MIHLSQAALAEVKRLRLKHPHPDAAFRLGAKPGGCSDFYYTLEFSEVRQSGDRVWDYHGIQIVVDPQSITYVDELTLDYSEDLMGGGFRFHNPSAAQHCGCGNSFSIREKE
jgi:iron-sulfur cluster assembly protein